MTIPHQEPAALLSDLTSLVRSAEEYFSGRELAQAMPLYVRAAMLAATQAPERTADLWRYAGLCAHELHESDLAISYFANALGALTDTTDQPRLLLRLHNNLAGVCLRASRLTEARVHGSDALALRELADHPQLVAAIHHNLGLIAGYLDEPGAAVAHFTDAYTAYATAGDMSKAAYALDGRAWALLADGRVDDAERDLVRAQAEKGALGEPTARIDVDLARVTLARGQHHNALTTAIALAKTPDVLANPDIHAEALLLAADAAPAPDAVGFAETGIAIASRLGYPPVLLRLLPRLFAAAEAANAPVPAHYRTLHDELLRRVAGTWVYPTTTSGTSANRKGGETHATTQSPAPLLDRSDSEPGAGSDAAPRDGARGKRGERNVGAPVRADVSPARPAAAGHRLAPAPDSIAGTRAVEEGTVAGAVGVAIRLLGRFQVLISGRAVRVPRGRPAALLAYLALHPNVFLSRQRLIDELWPPNPACDVFHQLRSALSEVNGFLRSARPTVVLDRTTQAPLVALRAAPSVIDAAAFTDAIATSGHDLAALRAATDRYQGELLEGIDDEWVHRPREEYRLRFLRAATHVANQLLDSGDASAALSYARRAVQTDPGDEDAAYVFIRAATVCGNISAATSQYELLRAELDGDSPSAHIVAFVETLRTQIVSNHSAPAMLAEPDTSGLFGRDSERARLLQFLADPSSAAILVTGPAGIGKSHLVASVVEHVHARGMTVYHGGCTDAPPPALWEPIIEALVDPLGAAIATGHPILSALLSAGSTQRQRGGRKHAGPADPIHASLFSEALLRLLPPAGQPPVLFVLDNVQWADEATAGWLSMLLRRIRTLSIRVILTARTERVGDADGRIASLVDRRAERITLAPLGRAAVKELIAATLQTPDPPGELTDIIWSHIGGNPLSVLSAIRRLQNQGLLRAKGSQWAVDGSARDALGTIASSQTAAMVAQRLAGLPGPARDIAAAAAVMGMDVVSADLRTVCGVPRAKFLDHLEELLHCSLLVSVDGGDGSRIRFPHEEIRAAVLGSLAPPRRHALHARVAEFLFAAGAAARPEYLFWHAEAADDTSRAYTAAVAAGDRCEALGQHKSAVLWYERALDRAAAQSLDARIEVDLKLEAALAPTGKREHQLAVLDRVIAAAKTVGSQRQLCEALIRRCTILTRRNRPTEAKAAGTAALAIARSRSDSDQQARAHRAIGLAYEPSGHWDSVRHLSKAVRLYRRAGATIDCSLALGELANAYDRLGDVRGAARAMTEAMSLNPPDHPTHPFLLARLAAFQVWRGRISDVIRGVTTALPLMQRVGDRMGEGRALRVLSDAYTLTGQYRDAWKAFVRSYRIAADAKDDRLAVSALNCLIVGLSTRLGLVSLAHWAHGQMASWLADDHESPYHSMGEDSVSAVYLNAGRWADARQWAERALATARANAHEDYITEEARLHLGHALIELGTPAPAIEHLSMARTYYRSAGELPAYAYAAALLAVALIDTGDRAGAQDHLRESIRLLQTIDPAQDMHVVRYLIGVVWTRLGATRQAGAAFRAARAEVLRIAAELYLRRKPDDGTVTPLQRRFLELPFQRRVLDAADGVLPPASAPPPLVLQPIESTGIRPGPHRARARRQAILRAFAASPTPPTLHALAAAMGVTTRTITSDLVALRRAGHPVSFQG